MTSPPPPPSSVGTAEGTYDELVIAPRKGWIGVNWGEIYRFRELLFFLVWRDIKVRYKQTVLGAAWAVLQPLLTATIFSILMGKVANNFPSDHLPRLVYFFANMLLWTFFAQGVTQGGLSLINQQQLLTKVYFPRLFVPTSVVGIGVVDVCLSLGVFGVMLAIFQILPHWSVILLPPLIALTAIATLGMSFLLSALTISYRDFRFILPFLIQIWMWVTVFYPLSQIENPNLQLVLALNPMAGILDAFRAMVHGHWESNAHPRLLLLSISATVSIGMFFLGMFYFRKTERRFADIA